ncbi:MAG: type II secretion system F family protein [Methanomicrobiaceae archaeon]|nr:type II secretion system F family protein [Methanomicrobiaceae archaeon]
MIIDRYVKWRISKNPNGYMSLRSDLISSRMGVTAFRYFYYTVSASVIFGILIGIFGYFISSLLFLPLFSIQIYDVFNIQLPTYEIPVLTKAAVGLISFLVFSVAGSVFFFILAMKFPGIQKSSRKTKINLSLHNAVSYMYAMRRGGAELMEIFNSISENADIYGEVALEFRQVVRDADYFGYDLVTALRNLSFTTPSEKFKDFLEDLLSVINSGGNISAYLESRVHLYQDEAKFEQKQFLSVLQLVAESYVTLFVAGPLFLIIIMVVMGMVGKSALIELTAVTYLLLPIGAFIFMLFVDLISIKDEEIERYLKVTVLNQFGDVKVEKKEGEEENFAKLDSYDRKRAFIEFIKNPLEWFITDPKRSLIIFAPLSIIYAALIIFLTPRYNDPEIAYAIIDDHIIIAALLIIIPYGILIELWRKRVRDIETGTPDFLDRLGGVNRVGMTLAGAIGVLVRANLGVISYEIRRIKRDIDWGASVSDALVRFEQRINTAAIARTVTLITKASEMSGEIGEVISIASSDARMSQVLKRERSSEMFIYTMIIYLAFFVFVFVVAVLDVNFLTILETMNTPASTGDIVQGAAFSQTSQMPIDAFRRLLYHTCVIQAFFSGFIAGQMGEGSLKAGVKHVAIMLVISLIIFNTMI